MMLYDVERHKSPLSNKWNAQELEEYCQSLLKKTALSFSKDKLWPVHPLDADSDTLPDVGFNDFYFGAAGTLWLLDYVGHHSHLDPKKEFLELFNRLPFNEPSNISLFFDKIGFLLFQEKLVSSLKTRDHLWERLKASPKNDLNEILYGTPSTLLIAFHAYKLTGDNRFLDIFNLLKESVLGQWNFEPEYDSFLWTQRFENPHIYLGAAHGTFGNLQVLFNSKELLGHSEIKVLETRATDIFQKFACTNEKHANWRVLAAPTSKFLLHWCHGAPGVICALADHLPPSKENHELFEKAGDLIWDAGPLLKGTSLCHGTAGNAMAFLKLFKRTQDEKWIERAKIFAMSCMKQCQEFESQYGQLRYSLWTGDLGLVWLNEQIKNKTADLPLLDCY